MSRILSKSFKYVPAAATDIRQTFKRIRAEQKKEREREKEHVVTSILRRRHG